MVIINGRIRHCAISKPHATAIKQASKHAAATTTMNDVGSRTQRALSTAAADAENLTVVVLP